MAQANAIKPYFTFVKGLVTEAGPLTYPENASIDEANLVLNKDGSRQRRLGIDYEPAYSLINTGSLYSTLSPLATSTYKWAGVGGKPGLIYNCVQISSTLYFFDASESSQSASLIGSVSVHTSSMYEKLSYADMQGNLVVASKETGQKVIVPVFTDGAVTSFVANEFSIVIRDMYGVEDGLAVDFRPTSLTQKHKYNLLNQGWTSDLINTFRTAEAVYPSNADIWHVAKDSSNNFNSDYLTKTHFGSTPAPKGRYLIDAFERGPSRAGPAATEVPICSTSWIGGTICLTPLFNLPTIPTLPEDTEYGKIGCVASYSGRVFYSGVTPNIVGGDARTPHYSGTVFYSKLVESFEDLGKCYQEADPTSEEISDVIASDGGLIPIIGAYNIVAMKEMSGALLIFAENGVWAISGTDKGFSAIDNMLRKVTDVGCLSAHSVVIVEGNTALYWTSSGIYSITGSYVDGFSATSITASTIQNLYDGISVPVKRNVKGTYDPVAKQARWLYTTSNSYSAGVNPSLFDKELVLDVALQAFYVNTIDNTGPYVADYISLTGEVANSVTYGVVVGSSPVVKGADSIVATYDYTIGADSGVKYLTIVPNTNMYFTFSVFSSTSFVDWYTYDSVGKDYSSYVVTGYELLQDSMRNKGSPYVTFHLRRTETGLVDVGGVLTPVRPSSCKVTAYWDFADSAASGKISQQFQAYRYNRPYIVSGVGDTLDYGQSVITTKNRIRGNGRALSLKIESEAGKDLHLYGWSTMFEGRTAV